MLTSEQIARIAELRAKGKGTRLISRELGISRHSVRRYFEKFGDPVERQQAERQHGPELGNPSPIPSYTVRPNAHPKGWEPGVRWDRGEGVVTWTDAEGEDSNFEAVLTHLGFDPEKYRIVSEVDARSWTMQTADGLHTARYFRAKIIPSLRDRELDEELVEALAKMPGRGRLISQRGTLVVNLADWQIGKRDGDGTLGVIERAKALIPAIADRIDELRKQLRIIDQVVIAGLGDLFEGCDGHYAQQTFTTEVNRRQQGNIVRRLLFDIISSVALLDVNVLVVAVGGNHGENRKDGKSFTDFGDNDDLFVFDQLADIFSNSPLRNVSFVIPTDELSVTLDIDGQIVTWAHGHQFRQGSHPADKMRNWMKVQALGRHPAGDSDILNSGHFHFLMIMQDYGRWLIQSPALESDSKWFRDSYGGTADPATLTYLVTPTGPQDFMLL